MAGKLSFYPQIVRVLQKRTNLLSLLPNPFEPFDLEDKHLFRNSAIVLALLAAGMILSSYYGW